MRHAIRAISPWLLAPCLLLGLTPLASTARAESPAGTASSAIAIGLPLVAAGIAFSRDDTEGLWQLGRSEALTLLATQVLKSSIRETRPNGEDAQSFPSRHAGVAFAAAHYLFKRYGWEAGLPAYAAAALTGYGRVEAKEHYWKDVAAGALIGITTSAFLTTPHRPTRVALNVGPNYAEVEVTAAW